MVEASREQGLEGIIAKRLDSRYEPGRRSGAWLKVKNRPSQEVVVGGWLPGQGRREDRIGSLAVGYYEDDAAPLRGPGGNRVQGGRPEAAGRAARARCAAMTSPFEGRSSRRRGPCSSEPKLVVEVEFANWTRTNTLRAPAYKGLRDDKDPQDVVLEREEGKARA